ncbi:MAG TPA: hypothetical protein VIL73_01950, partial [Gaiellaceae bacterium]
VSWGTLPLGVLAGGFLIEALGPRSTFLVLAGIFTVVAIGATSSRVIREVPPVDSLLRTQD